MLVLKSIVLYFYILQYNISIYKKSYFVWVIYFEFVEI